MKLTFLASPCIKTDSRYICPTCYLYLNLLFDGRDSSWMKHVACFSLEWKTQQSTWTIAATRGYFEQYRISLKWRNYQSSTILSLMVLLLIGDAKKKRKMVAKEDLENKRMSCLQPFFSARILFLWSVKTWSPTSVSSSWSGRGIGYSSSIGRFVLGQHLRPSYLVWIHEVLDGSQLF